MHEILRLRLIYFFSYAVYGVALPYLPLIFHELGFDDSAISLCLLGLGVAALLSPALTAHVADRHWPWNQIMAGLFVGGSGSSLLWLHMGSVLGAFTATLMFFLFFSHSSHKSMGDTLVVMQKRLCQLLIQLKENK